MAREAVHDGPLRGLGKGSRMTAEEEDLIRWETDGGSYG